MNAASGSDESEAKDDTKTKKDHEMAWDAVASILDRLSASGRSFGDSANLIRKDRER